jgi:hypothetical protein
MTEMYNGKGGQRTVMMTTTMPDGMQLNGALQGRRPAARTKQTARKSTTTPRFRPGTVALREIVQDFKTDLHSLPSLWKWGTI